MTTSSTCDLRAPAGGAEQQQPQIVERVFERLAAMYGAKLADLWRGCDMASIKQTWAAALAGYRHDEIRRGLQGCLTRPWPPTLPEFLSLCRPQIDHEAAYREAVEQIRRRDDGMDQWSHPAIYWAATRITAHELHSSSWPGIKNRWTAVLNEELAKGQWPEVPPRRPALAAPGKSFTCREEGKKRIAALLAEMEARQRRHMPHMPH